MKNTKNTKFIGLDVHKQSISLAIADEGAEGGLDCMELLRIQLRLSTK